MSRLIWITDINGNASTENGKILFELRRQGISAGARKSKIDLISAEQNALIALPELSWLAVNIKGCRASIEVRERTAPPATDTARAPATSSRKGAER